MKKLLLRMIDIICGILLAAFILILPALAGFSCLYTMANAQSVTPIVRQTYSLDLSKPLPILIDAWQGETFEIVAQCSLYGKPVRLPPAATATLYYQTREMATTGQWYSAPAAIDPAASTVTATWSPTIDPGATHYTFHLAIEAAGAKSYRIHGAIKLRPSPNFNPATIKPSPLLWPWSQIDNIPDDLCYLHNLPDLSPYALKTDLPPPPKPQWVAPGDWTIAVSDPQSTDIRTTVDSEITLEQRVMQYQTVVTRSSASRQLSIKLLDPSFATVDKPVWSVDNGEASITQDGLLTAARSGMVTASAKTVDKARSVILPIQPKESSVKRKVYLADAAQSERGTYNDYWMAYLSSRYAHKDALTTRSGYYGVSATFAQCDAIVTGGKWSSPWPSWMPPKDAFCPASYAPAYGEQSGTAIAQGDGFGFMINAGHWSPPKIGAVVKFLDPAGVTHQVKIASYIKITDWAKQHGHGDFDWGWCGGDIRLIKYTGTLPDACIARFISKDALDARFGTAVGLQAYTIGQLGNICPCTLSSYHSAVAGVGDYWAELTRSDIIPYYRQAHIMEIYNGDSGRPTFLYVDNKPVIIFINTYPQSGASMIIQLPIIRDFVRIESSGKATIKEIQ